MKVMIFIIYRYTCHWRIYFGLGPIVYNDSQISVLKIVGIVSMARGGSPDSGGSSFFVMYGDAPHLDMQYGIFG